MALSGKNGGANLLRDTFSTCDRRAHSRAKHGLCLVAAAAMMFVASMMWVGLAMAADQPAVDPALAARMAKEKDARRSCQISICQAFAHPETGSPIACDMTKTWPREEILTKITGGSYIWGYGHLQCSIKLNLDRGAFAKAASDATAVVTLAEHKMSCNVGDKDPAKVSTLKTDVTITPKMTFAKRKVTAMSFGTVKTEGSAVASAAITSLMAIDAVSGIVSRAATAELNDFFFTKCKEEGFEIVPKP